MTRSPLVSCIVAAYNYERYVGAALQSALAQDYPADALEVIVVDDGSTDRTPEVVAEAVAASGGRIRSVRQENGGLGAATTRGLREARGEYVTVLDADDLWPADRVRILVDFLETRPEVGLAYGDMELIDADGALLHPSDLRHNRVEPRSGRVLGALLAANFISAPALMFRASLMDRVCPIPAVAPYQDWWFAARAAEVSEIGFVDATLARYRRHGENMNWGAQNGRLLDHYERELPWRRWMLSNLRTEQVPVDELVAAHGFMVQTAHQIAQGRGRPLAEVVPVTDDDRRRAQSDVAAARPLLADADFQGAAAAFTRALAADPWNYAATTGLEHALRGLVVPLPTGDPDETVHAGDGARRFCIKPGYVHRAAPEYFVDLTEERDRVVWQPEVYPQAADIARRLGSRRIVDIGAGTAGKLVRLHPEFEIVGIDFGPNLELCRERYPFGTWREHDLESEEPLPLSPAELAGSILICADVIEHLVHPDRLLTKLRDALRHADALLLSTPERDRTRGADHLGPPPHVCHVREWSLEELGELLGEWGFEHGTVGLTRSNSASLERHTTLAVLFPDAERDQLANAA